MPTGQPNGTPHPSQAVADIVDAWVQLCCLPFKCLSGFLGGVMPTKYHSMTFDFPQAAGLTLVPGPLQLGIAALGNVAEHLPSAAVSCDPTKLDATTTTFRLVVEATQLQRSPGGTYVGQVTAQLDPNNPQPNPPTIPVWIVIP